MSFNTTRITLLVLPISSSFPVRKYIEKIIPKTIVTIIDITEDATDATVFTAPPIPENIKPLILLA